MQSLPLRLVLIAYLCFPVILRAQQSEAVLKKLSVHPLIKLIGKKETDPAVKKAIAGAGLQKTEIGTYNKMVSNTLQNVMPVEGLFDNLSYSYFSNPYRAVSEITKPAFALPLQLNWGMTESDFYQQEGMPLWVEFLRTQVFSNTHYFVLPAATLRGKVVVVSFEFRNANRGGSDPYRLSDIRISTRNKTEATGTGNGKIPGAQYSEFYLKIKPAAPVPVSDGKITDLVLKKFIQERAEEGYTLVKTYYPQFDRAYVNDAMRVETDALPGKTNVVAILVKDSFDVGSANFLEAKMLDKNGKIAWSKKALFPKLMYNKQAAYYYTGANIPVPQMPSATRYVITFTYYDKNWLNRPVYALIFTK